MKKVVAIISEGVLGREPRVLTEIAALKEGYEIVIFGRSSNLTHRFYPLEFNRSRKRIVFHLDYPVLLRKSISLLINVYLKVIGYWDKVYKYRTEISNAQLVKSVKPNLVILHGVNSLNWVAKALDDQNCKLIVNMHEYYPLEFEDETYWNKHIKPKYISNIIKFKDIVSAYFVVCESIIKKYKEEFDLKNQLLVRNSKPFVDLAPVLNNDGIIRMIHHGVCNASRKIHLVIDCMSFLPDNYRLDLMLVPDTIVYPALLQKAKEDKRINFIPTVPTNQISKFINKYDIGVFLLPPSNFNYLNALPNKLFEFIQARLAIVVSPNPEMKDLVEKHALGIVSKDYTPEEFAMAILVASKDISSFKNNSDKAAKIINDEEEQKKILKEVDRLCAE